MDPQIEMVQKVCRYLDEGDSDAVNLLTWNQDWCQCVSSATHI